MDRHDGSTSPSVTPEQLAAVRAAYFDHAPLKEIAAEFGLKRWQLAALTREFRAEANMSRSRPKLRLSHDIKKIVLPTRTLARDGGSWQYGSVTLPRITFHVQELRERGYAEI